MQKEDLDVIVHNIQERNKRILNIILFKRKKFILNNGMY